MEIANDSIVVVYRPETSNEIRASFYDRGGTALVSDTLVVAGDTSTTVTRPTLLRLNRAGLEQVVIGWMSQSGVSLLFCSGTGSCGETRLLPTTARPSRFTLAQLDEQIVVLWMEEDDETRYLVNVDPLFGPGEVLAVPNPLARAIIRPTFDGMLAVMGSPSHLLFPGSGLDAASDALEVDIYNVTAQPALSEATRARWSYSPRCDVPDDCIMLKMTLLGSGIAADDGVGFIVESVSEAGATIRTHACSVIPRAAQIELGECTELPPTALFADAALRGASVTIALPTETNGIRVQELSVSGSSSGAAPFELPGLSPMSPASGYTGFNPIASQADRGAVLGFRSGGGTHLGLQRLGCEP